MLVLLVLLTAGCSGGTSKPTLSPGKTLAAAKRQLDATSGVRIGLSTPRLPRGVDGLLSADGVGTHDPAFAGMIKVGVSGASVPVPVVAVDGKVRAMLPFTTTYATIDPADYNAPDPAHLMDPDGGLSSLLTSAEDIRAGKKVRQGKVVLRGYTAKVPGAAVASIIPSADAKATFDATFAVTDAERLVKTVLRGPFYPKGGDVTYTVTLSDYGTKKQITAP